MTKKIFSLIVVTILLFFCEQALAEVALDDVNTPLDIFYRLGTTDSPEQKVDYEIKPTITPIVQIPEVKPAIENTKNITYADLSIKKMSLEMAKSIDIDYNDMQADLSLLWQGAAMRSDTIKFAIYKLSNPEKDKPDSGAVKKVLSTIAGMSTFLGAGTGNPLLASAALIGGNTLGIMSQDVKALNYKYTKVTDADMIILVRKVDELQQKIVDMYYDYMTARERYNMTTRMVEKSYSNYKHSEKLQKEVILITDTFYRSALDEQMKARGNFFEKRSKLEQLVGNQIFQEFENSVDKRENNKD